MSPRKTILLIDDEIDLVDSLRDLLTHNGYTVETAFNGIEGLQRLAQCRPDLIVLDMNMPIMGGLAFMQHLMEAQKGALPYPILVLTARINLESVFKDLKIDFLPKPFLLQDLLKKTETMIGGPHSENKKPAPADPEKTAAETPEAGKRVLILEKDGNKAHQLSHLFQAAKYHVATAATGGEGLSKAASYLPDLILIHTDLADMPSDVVALKLKMLPKITDIPVVLYTDKEKFPENYVAAGRIYEKINVKMFASIKDANALFKQTVFLVSEDEDHSPK